MSLPEAKATAIAACLAQGYSVNRIVKELGTSCHTVTAIARNRPELVDQFREITRRNWQAVAMLATGELIDRVPNMKDQGLAVAAAIATEKMELLGGNATARIEHASRPAAEEWAEMLASLPANVQARPVQAVDPLTVKGRMAVDGESLAEDVVEGVAVLIGNTGQADAAKDVEVQPLTVSGDQSGDVQSSAFDTANRVKPPLVSGLVSNEPPGFWESPPIHGVGAGEASY
jgi:hypothetical protein